MGCKYSGRTLLGVVRLSVVAAGEELKLCCSDFGNMVADFNWVKKADNHISQQAEEMGGCAGGLWPKKEKRVGDV